MPSTYVKLASTTVGAGGSASVTFSSIPQTYTDLCLKVSARGTNASTTVEMLVSFNGVSTSLSSRLIYGSGAAVGSVAPSNIAGGISAANDTSNTFGNSEIYIPNYAGSNNKSVSFDSVSENNATTAYQYLTAGLWSNTAPITSITLTPAASNFAQYSTATLYGVLKYAETGTGSKATGGTVTTSGGYTYHTFFSSGMFTPTTNISGAEVLVVAGGGGTTVSVSGGGGAGGLVYASSQSYTSGVNYAAIVGAGGSADCNGTNSAFAAGTVAIGGGACTTSGGITGGSGGGQPAPGSLATGSGTAGQGNSGGAKGSAYSGGGGGNQGAGGVGGVSSRGGDGGVGQNAYSAFGAATGTGELIDGVYWYAGGGGGSAWNGVTSNNIGGNAGKGGGGRGGEGGGGSAQASNGLPFTGGGAGGDNTSGKKGGSGIVIVRYTT